MRAQRLHNKHWKTISQHESLQVDQAINGYDANVSITEDPASDDDTEAGVVIDHGVVKEKIQVCQRAPRENRNRDRS